VLCALVLAAGGAAEARKRGRTASASKLNPDTGVVKSEQQLRSQPQLGSRTLGKVPRNATVTVIEQTGAWVLVKWRRSVGWLPQAAFSKLPQRTGDSGESPPTATGAAAVGPGPETPGTPAGGAESDAARTERQARFLRRDNRFGDQGIPSNVQRVVVVASTAALLARPVESAPVVGTANTFEELPVIRQSRDGTWYLVDLGGGESAWVASSAVRPGDKKRGFKGQLDTPAAAARGKGWASDRDPTTEAGRGNDAPSTTTSGAAVTDGASTAPDASTSGATQSDGASEASSRADVESSDGKEGDEGDGEPSPAPTVEVPADAAAVIAQRDEMLRGRTDKPPGWLRNVEVHASLGYSAWRQTFRSDSDAQLGNYRISAGAMVLGLGAAYTRPMGRYLYLRGLASYRLTITTPGVDVPPAMMGQNPVTLSYLAHDLDLSAQVLAPVWRHRLRPFLRMGASVVLHKIGTSTQAPLPSDRVLGLLLGFGLEAPARVLRRPLVGRFELDLLPTAQRAQTGGLREGTASSTFGYGLTLGARVRLSQGWSASFDYQLQSIKTTFQGAPDTRRTAGAGGTRTDTAHIVLLGLGTWL
jgi:hypothetical protein